MVALAVLGLLCPSQSPLDDLMKALIAYQKLDAFSATIEHHDSSGLYPGSYREELKWRKGNRFELRVTQKSNFKPTADNPGSLAPNWFCDGSQVTWIGPDKSRKTTSIDPGPNTMPGWEVSGGPVLSALMNTATLQSLAHLPPDIKFAPGTRSTWKGEKVREVAMTSSNAQMQMSGSFFLTPDGEGFVGFETNVAGRTGYMHYLDAKRNPKLPDKLGEAPGH